jgi:hypothetical protein
MKRTFYFDRVEDVFGFFCEGRMEELEVVGSEASAVKNPIAKILRAEIASKIAPILQECDRIMESNSRLMIQAYCLDVVTGVEDVIRAYQLEDH